MNGAHLVIMFCLIFKAQTIFSRGLIFPGLGRREKKCIRWAANHLFQLYHRALERDPKIRKSTAITLSVAGSFRIYNTISGSCVCVFACVWYDFMDFRLSAIYILRILQLVVCTKYCPRTNSFNRKHVRTINTRPHIHLSHAGCYFFSFRFVSVPYSIFQFTRALTMVFV